MNPTSVTFKALNKNAILPIRQTPGAAGYDVHCITSGIIKARSLATLKLGFIINVPFSLLGIFMGRSGLALKNGLEVKGSYIKNEEEAVVHIFNNSDVDFKYESGMRIAQLLLARVENVEFVEGDL